MSPPDVLRCSPRCCLSFPTCFMSTVFGNMCVLPGIYSYNSQVHIFPNNSVCVVSQKCSIYTTVKSKLAIMICVRMSVMHTNALPCPNVCKYER